MYIYIYIYISLSIYISGPALCVIFSPRDYLSAPRQDSVLNLKFIPAIFMRGGWGGKVGCGSCCFLGERCRRFRSWVARRCKFWRRLFPELEPGLYKERDAGAFARGGPTLQIMAPASPKGWNRVCIDSLYPVRRCRARSPFPAPRTLSEACGTEVDATFAAV